MPSWDFHQQHGAGVMALLGDWVTGSVRRAPEILTPGPDRALHTVSFDTGRLGRWDMMLVAFLWDIKTTAAAAGVLLDDSALPLSARQLLKLLPTERHAQQSTTRTRFLPFSQALARMSTLLEEIGASTVLVGATALGTVKLFIARGRFRGVDLLTDMLNAGPRAIAVVGTVNFLVGAILAYIGAAELAQFAAQTYIANLVGVASVREIASVMTAIVMAGRTGGAYAARIASMQSNEEIAALRVVGIPVGEFVVLPSVVSLCLAMPILYLIGCFIAILGGLAVATLSLGFTAMQYLRETLDAIPLADFAFGAVKSVVFAALIGTVSCRMGLTAGRGARAVGDAATGAVVANILGIIVLDAAFAMMMDARGQ